MNFAKIAQRIHHATTKLLGPIHKFVSYFVRDRIMPGEAETDKVAKVLNYLVINRWKVARHLRQEQRDGIISAVNQKRSLKSGILYELNYKVSEALVCLFVEDFVDIHTPLKQLTDAALVPPGKLNSEENFEDKAEALEKFSARVVQTARSLADFNGSPLNEMTSGPVPAGANLLNSLTEQVENLTPQLIKAGRIWMASDAKNNESEHFEDLSRQYAETIADIRQFCDDIIFWADFTRPSEQLIHLFMADCEDAVIRREPQRLLDNTLNITRLANRMLIVYKHEIRTREELRDQMEKTWELEENYRSVTNGAAIRMEAELTSVVQNANLLASKLDDLEITHQWRYSNKKFKDSVRWVREISENILRFSF